MSLDWKLLQYGFCPRCKTGQLVKKDTGYQCEFYVIDGQRVCQFFITMKRFKEVLRSVRKTVGKV